MLLLDSHVLLWIVRNESRLGSVARRMVEDADGVHVSAVTVFELTVKSLLGKIVVPSGLPARLAKQGFLPLQITADDAEAVREFPELAKHDPFDRLLMAQAYRSGLPLLTADRVLLALDRPFVLDATR